jgi:hypothetical protein
MPNAPTTSSIGDCRPRSDSTSHSNSQGGTGRPLEKLQKDLKEFIALLNSHGVDYLIVGGHAVAFHGFPRYTGDFDFFVRMSEDNATALLRVLAAFGFGDLGVERHTFLEPNQVLQLGRPPNRIDLLTTISGVDFDEAWARRVPAELDSLAVSFIGKEELLRNKRAAGRPKDLGDVSKLTDR